jgi:hypothetical protein
VETDQRPLSPEPAACARLTWAARLTEHVRASPYYPAISHPVLRRILPATAASALGDGMSAVAIAWLALRLAPAGSRGLWVAQPSRPTRCPGRPGRWPCAAGCTAAAGPG